MKSVQVGVSAMYYGTVTVDVPDEIETEDDAREWLEDHWADVPLPSGMSYVGDSAELDEESVAFVS